MGFMIVYGDCYVCKKLFTFSAERVPSIRDVNGTRHPVCRNCIERANRLRVEKGLDPLPILPDAYGADEA